MPIINQGSRADNSDRKYCSVISFFCSWELTNRFIFFWRPTPEGSGYPGLIAARLLSSLFFAVINETNQDLAHKRGQSSIDLAGSVFSQPSAVDS